MWILRTFGRSHLYITNPYFLRFRSKSTFNSRNGYQNKIKHKKDKENDKDVLDFLHSISKTSETDWNIQSEYIEKSNLTQDWRRRLTEVSDEKNDTNGLRVSLKHRSRDYKRGQHESLAKSLFGESMSNTKEVEEKTVFLQEKEEGYNNVNERLVIGRVNIKSESIPELEKRELILDDIDQKYRNQGPVTNLSEGGLGSTFPEGLMSKPEYTQNDQIDEFSTNPHNLNDLIKECVRARKNTLFTYEKRKAIVDSIIANNPLRLGLFFKGLEDMKQLPSLKFLRICRVMAEKLKDGVFYNNEEEKYSRIVELYNYQPGVDRHIPGLLQEVNWDSLLSEQLDSNKDQFSEIDKDLAALMDRKEIKGNISKTSNNEDKFTSIGFIESFVSEQREGLENEEKHNIDDSDTNKEEDYNNMYLRLAKTQNSIKTNELKVPGLFENKEKNDIKPEESDKKQDALNDLNLVEYKEKKENWISKNEAEKAIKELERLRVLKKSEIRLSKFGLQRLIKEREFLELFEIFSKQLVLNQNILEPSESTESFDVEVTFDKESKTNAAYSKYLNESVVIIEAKERHRLKIDRSNRLEREEEEEDPDEDLNSHYRWDV